MLHTGLRKGELLGLRWRDAHPDSWHEQSSGVAVVLPSAPPLPDDRMLTIFRAIAMGTQDRAGAPGT